MLGYILFLQINALSLFCQKVAEIQTKLRLDHPNNLGHLLLVYFQRWPIDLADQVRSSLEVKSSQP